MILPFHFRTDRYEHCSGKRGVKSIVVMHFTKQAITVMNPQNLIDWIPKLRTKG